MFAFAFPALGQTERPELVVYAYDSFVARGGLGPEIAPIFEKQCQCKLKLLGSGDGAQLLSRLQLDSKRDRPTAHVVVGLDQNIWEKAKPYTEEWGDWMPQGYDKISEYAAFEKGFLPYDFGVFAFMVDQKFLAARGLKAPGSLRDLLKPEWKRAVILEDPRTSTPGFSFLLYTHEVLKKGAWSYWGKLKSQWLTLAPGWDSAYGMFLKGEVPLVWSYTTSQAYHIEKEHMLDGKPRYTALIFWEGHPVQIEGAAFVKGALKSPWDRDRARMFLEFLISPDVQKRIPQKNWMLPAIKDTPLPESFKKLPKARKLLKGRPSAQEMDEILSQWSRAVE